MTTEVNSLPQCATSAPSVPACINLQMLRTSHFVLRTYDDAYRALGVRATQVPVLGIIARRGPVTIRAIADELESERSVMSRKLKVMVDSGWVVEDADSGKEKTFVLTEAGEELVTQLAPIREAVQQRLMARLTQQEQQLLLSLCGKLTGE